MKIRKGLSILLSVCMLFCMAPLAVSADESAYDAVPGGSQEYADTAVEESEEIYMPAEEQTEVPAEEQTEIPAEEQVDYQTEDQSEDSVTEEAVPHEHSYFAIETSDPTCTEQGYTVFSCACGDRYTEYSAVLGHDWDGGVVTAEPTAESEGVLTYTCSRCGENRAEQIPVPETEEEVPTDVHEHSYIAEETVGPTCTEQGYTVYTCSCGDTYTEITDPLEHEWDEGIVTLEPTAENEGEITYTCIRCGEIKTENIEIIDEEVPDEDISVEEAYATKPTKLWLEPSEANGIPVRIDVFAKRTGGTNYNPTYTYLLCLPGNAVLENCFLSWDGDMRATLDGQTYDSGTCPIPAIGSPKTYTFRNGNQTAASFNVVAYQGSLAVHPVFIEIDESLGTIAAMNSDKNNTCSGTIYIDGVQYVLDKMKGRGNATWTESDDKKPYNITLGTKITFGLNTPKTKKWSFMAEVLDRSLLSNRSGFWLAEQLGIGQATTSADVWMNGEYKGCYMVTPKTDSYVTDNGFMVEQDNYKEDSVANGGDPQFSLDGLVSRVSGWSSAYNLITVKKMGDNLLLNNGVVDESPANMEAAASMIQAWLQDAWDAIRSETGYNAKGKYYTDYIDIDSFAKMYLMHEYIKSYDVCAGSILFHRDGQTDTDKLIAGPLWDLDNAMGAVYQNSSLGKADDRSNGDRRSAEGYFISNITYNGDANLEYKTSIYKALGKHEDFMQAVKIQYNQYKWAFDSLPGVVDELIDEIRASAQMNHAKVNDIGHGTGKDNHYYSRAQSFGSGQYRQSYIATSQWSDYTANLHTYAAVRTQWFADHYYDATICIHEYEGVVTTEATCISEGVITYTCSKCGDSYTEILPKTAHDYQDGVCTVCGAQLPAAVISCDEGASITVYETQSLDGAYIENAAIAYPRDSKTGLFDDSGDGQINFVVNLAPGYTLSSVTAEPISSYKNLKKSAVDGVENSYRITKVTGDITITVSTIAPIISAEGVSLSKSELTMAAGASETLTAVINPEDATNRNIVWNSSNEAVASVDQSGKVIAVAAGTATITVTTEDGGHTATCTVTVTIPVSDVTLNKQTVILPAGTNETLTATVAPNTATNKNVTWSSSNTAVASVDQNGTITAVAAGTADITATTEDGGHTATCTVTVTVPVTGITLNKQTMTLSVGTDEKLTATVAPDTATNQNVIWSSSNISVASVDQSGKVTAVAAGTATITATTEDGGYSAECTVIAVIPVSGLRLDKTEIIITEGDNEKLTATVQPDGATNQNVTWSSSDAAVAVADANGVVTAVATGTASITATSADGGFTAVCTVTVIPRVIPVTRIRLDKTQLTLIKGSTGQLTATVEPGDATDKEVIWTSDDVSVAEVSSGGLVTALSGGTTTVRATTKDGGYTAGCTVTVKVPVTGITMNKQTVTLAAGTNETLIATVAPDTATNKNVTWSSSNTSVASVDQNGKVTAVAAGTADITVTTEDGGYTAKCTVTVTVPVTGIRLNKQTVTLSAGMNETLTATVAPDSATNKKVSWNSSNTAVASVDQSGKVTAVTEGTATITVTTEDGGYTAACTVTVVIPVTGISLEKTEMTITEGNSDALTVTVLPSGATNKRVTWSSSDTAVVTVDTSGVVTAVAPGTASITATSADGGFKAVCAVTVIPRVIPVTGIRLDKTQITLIKGSTGQLTATVEPGDATDKEVIWTSDNVSVATVSSDGLVTAVSGGTTIVRATTKDGGYTAGCTVTVKVPVTGITLNIQTLTLSAGTNETLTATVAPDTATNKKVIWSSSNTSVASVDQSGKVTAVAAGTADITVTTEDDGYTAKCTVTVIVPVTGITLNKQMLTLSAGKSETLTAIVAPDNATNKKVSWSSSNTSVASIDQSGKVTAVAAGTASITVTTEDGGYTAACTVTVTIPVTGIHLDKTEMTLEEGKSDVLTASIVPDNATNKRVTWNSSNAAVAIVDANGVVSAVSKGTAVIAVVSEDGGYTDKCTVTVTEPAPAIIPVTGIRLDKTRITLIKGSSGQLTAMIEPADATDKEVIWTSDDVSVATVSTDGLVTAVSGGTTTVRATTKDGGYTAGCTVTVTVPVTGVALNKQTVTLVSGTSETLTAIVAPDTATNRKVSWNSSNTAVATVDQNGKVTAVTAGTADITVTTEDGGYTAKCTVTVTVPATGVTLNKQTLTLSAGKSETLTAIVAPDTATNKKVSWSSSNTAVASVDQNGKVTAIAAGTADITVTTEDGVYTAKCTVTVSIPVTGIRLDKTEMTLEEGKSDLLTASVVPDNATNKKVTWSSSDTAVVIVDTNGVVTAVAPGTASITATSEDGGFKAVCTVTVIPRVIPVTGVRLDKNQITLIKGSNEQLTATVEPGDATDKEVIWTSDNVSVATVSTDGLVTAVSGGTTTIRVTTKDGGYTAGCTVTVTVPVTGVTLNKQTMTLAAGTNETLTATVAPDTATNKKVSWSSNNTAVASVDQNGKVSAVAAGTADITVTTEDGGYTAKCIITVTVPVTGVTLNKQTMTLSAGTNETLTVSIVPDNATNKKMTWSSSNSSVASVDQSGKVTAVAAGTATITVTMEDGGYTAGCTVTVTIPVTGISLDKTEVTVTEGNSDALTVTVMPSGATNKKVIWSSSDTAVVTVDANGVVTAVAPGTANITATSEDGGFKAVCTVTVIPKVIPVAGISLNKQQTSIPAGSTEKLTAVIIPENASNKEIIWTSGNNAAAEVSDDGLVTAKAKGTAVIKATSKDGGYTAECTVTVTVPVTGISLNKASVTLATGKSETLTASVIPSDATNRKMIWSSSNKVVASVDQNGKVAAVAAGTADITVATEDGGYTAKCTVTVTIPVTGVSLNRKEISLTEDEKETLTAVVIPSDATNRSVTWGSSNTAIAKVDQNGVITAVGAGTTVINVTTADGGYKAACTVIVIPKAVPVTGVSLNKSSLELTVGASETLTAVIVPTNATNRNILWSSDNTSIASVDSTGKVTAKKAGTTKISVMTQEGGFTASCTVKVTNPPDTTVHVTGISVSNTSLTLKRGETAKLTVTITPSNATDKSVQWSTSNAVVASVSSDGQVTAKAKGTAIISVASVDSDRIASCTVTVTEDPAPVIKNGWYTENGKEYWYENGVKQGTTGRGKEIYDPGTDAWYWLDAVQGGAKAVSKDVYQESNAGKWADGANGTGKWVRYDANGHMVKGWQTVDGKTYYFDRVYGTMAKGYATIDGKEYYFDPRTGVLTNSFGDVPKMGWKRIGSKDYWYENYERQGVSNVKGYRGKEIYFSGKPGIANPNGLPAGWYWLDNIYGGAKAANKEVYMPYTYNGKDNIGKWVRYDSVGQMIKGWYETGGKTYYYNLITGAMMKGTQVIDGKTYYFDEVTGVMK